MEDRLWANGTTCPHCGVIGEAGKLQGKSTRIGVWKCYACRKPFTVKVGTIFESSHIKLHLWLQAMYLVASSKKGISSNQLHRTLGITLKSAWFMSHRIREAMRDNGMQIFGTGGGVVEVDETFIGHDKSVKAKGDKKGRGFHHKNKVLSLVDRTTGQARSIVIDDMKGTTILPILRANIAREARVMTDEAAQYSRIHYMFEGGHGFTRHGQGEYVSRIDPSIHTNTIEGFFSVFKRGMKGTYQHCGHNHLNHYLAEFDFRYNTRKSLGVEDNQRAERLLMGVKGKRLTYQSTAG